MIERGVMSWRSAKHTITTSSTIRAKCIACFEAKRQALKMKNFIARLDFVMFVLRLLNIYYDISTTISLSHNIRSSSCSKHIDIKYLFIREKIDQSYVSVWYIPTELILDDPLTKAYSKSFLGTCDLYGILESSFIC